MRFIFICIILEAGICKYGLVSSKKVELDTTSSTAFDQITHEVNDKCHKDKQALTNGTLNIRRNKKIHVNSEVFEEYIKHLNLKIVPGLHYDNGFATWIPPEEIQKDVQQFLSGFDSYNRPIWVLEYGKINYFKYATGGKNMQALFHKYNRYLAYGVLKSMAYSGTKDNPVEQYILIIDFQGLTPVDVLHPEVRKLRLKVVSDYRRWAEKYIAKIVLLNVNPIAEILINLCRYFLLRLYDKMEIYGTNRAHWVPQLVKTFSKDQLPEKFGGCKGFEPILVV